MSCSKGIGVTCVVVGVETGGRWSQESVQFRDFPCYWQMS